MEIIGQNGNDGEHYSGLDLNNDGVINEKDIEIAKNRIKEIDSILEKTPNLSREWAKRLSIERRKLDDDENTKIY